MVKQNELPLKVVTDSVKIYLQWQLNGGFWDTDRECTEADYLAVEKDWEERATFLMDQMGYKVRLLGIRIERIFIITELSLMEE